MLCLSDIITKVFILFRHVGVKRVSYGANTLLLATDIHDIFVDEDGIESVIL